MTATALQQELIRAVFSTNGNATTNGAITGKHIVVGQRGFVWMGNVTEDGEYIVIDDCNCIRTWGTSRGLGEIATSGPTSKTVLDPQPQTRVHRLAVVELIRCK